MYVVFPLLIWSLVFYKELINRIGASFYNPLTEDVEILQISLSDNIDSVLSESKNALMTLESHSSYETLAKYNSC